MGTLVPATVANTILEKQRFGFNAMTISNFDSDLEPQVIGKVEVGGGLYEFPTLESITGWSSISNDTHVTIYLVPDGSTGIDAEFRDTGPLWNNTLNGWYDSGGTDRAIAKLYKDSSGNYAYKYLYENINKELPFIKPKHIVYERSASHTATVTGDFMFHELEHFVPNVDDVYPAKGNYVGWTRNSGATRIVQANIDYLKRTSTTVVTLVGSYVDWFDGVVSPSVSSISSRLSFTDGSSTTYPQFPSLTSPLSQQAYFRITLL